MTEVIEKQVEYAYDDLDDKAKEKAMQWHINCVRENFGSEEASMHMDSAREDGEQFAAYIEEVYLSEDSTSFDGYFNTYDFVNYLTNNKDGTVSAELQAQYGILLMLVDEGWVRTKIDFHSDGFSRHITKVSDFYPQLDELFEGDRDVLKNGPLAGANVKQLADSISYGLLLDDMVERMTTKINELGDKTTKAVQADLEWLTSEECFKECEYVNGWRFTKDGNIL